MMAKVKIPVYAIEINRDGEKSYLTNTNGRMLKSHLPEEMQAIEDNRRREANKFQYQVIPGNVVLLGYVELEIELPEGLLELVK